MLEIKIIFTVLTFFTGLYLFRILQNYKNSGRQKKTVVSMMASIVLCALFFAFCQMFSGNAWMLNISEVLFVLDSAFCFYVFGFSIVTLLVFGKPNKNEEEL